MIKKIFFSSCTWQSYLNQVLSHLKKKLACPSSKKGKRCGRKKPGKIILWMKIVNFRFPLWSRLVFILPNMGGNTREVPTIFQTRHCLECFFAQPTTAFQRDHLSEAIYQNLSGSAFCLVCHQIHISPSHLPGSLA